MPQTPSLLTRLPAPRILVLGLVLGLLAMTIAPSAALAQSNQDSAVEASQAAADKVVVFGVPGLTMADIDPERTPNLYKLVSTGAAANLNVRTIGASTCPASGWLSLGSGSRAQAGPPSHPIDESDARCPSIIEPSVDETNDFDDSHDSDSEETLPENSGTAAPGTSTARIPGFSSVKEPNQASGYSVDYGMMSRLVGAAEHLQHPHDGNTTEACLAAEGPGAAYAAADDEGVVRNYTEDVTNSNCRVDIIDLGAIGSQAWLDDPLPKYPYTAPTHFDRDVQVAEADEMLGQRLASIRLSADKNGVEPTIVVAGIGDSSPLPRLRALIASGPGFAPGTLSSSTTRSPGLLQLTDLAPGILDLLSIPSPSGIGFDSTESSSSTDDRLGELVIDARKAATVHENLATFSTILDVIFYALFILCGVLLSSAFFVRRGGPTIHKGLAWASLAIATLPMGAFLAGVFPWARLENPGLGLAAAVAAGSAVVFGISLIPPWGRSWRGRVAALALASVLVIAVDLVTGSRLQGNSLLGYNPIVGGRYYGLGNQGAAIFIVGLFMFLGLTISWLRAKGHLKLVIAVPAVVGLVAVFVSGNPSWGAKFGGTIATLAGLLVLLALVSRIRLSFFRLALIGIASLAALLGIAFLDWLRDPGARSHFGNFFEQLVSGEAVRVIERKLTANLHIMQINPALAIVTPLAIIAIVFFLRYLLLFPRTERFPKLVRATNSWRGRLPRVFEDRDVHFGFLAAATGLAVGLVLTDSGIAVPSTGAMVLLPYLLALSAEHADESATTSRPLHLSPTAPPSPNAPLGSDSSVSGAKERGARGQS